MRHGHATIGVMAEGPIDPNARDRRFKLELARSLGGTRQVRRYNGEYAELPLAPQSARIEHRLGNEFGTKDIPIDQWFDNFKKWVNESSYGTNVVYGVICPHNSENAYIYKDREGNIQECAYSRPRR